MINSNSKGNLFLNKYWAKVSNNYIGYNIFIHIKNIILNRRI